IVGVVDEEINGAVFRIRLALAQKHLLSAEVHAGEGGRLAPGEGEHESELLGVEPDRLVDVGDGQSRLDLLALDVGWLHGAYYHSPAWLPPSLPPPPPPPPVPPRTSSARPATPTSRAATNRSGCRRRFIARGRTTRSKISRSCRCATRSPAT